jgi:hypothetical protein
MVICFGGFGLGLGLGSGCGIALEEPPVYRPTAVVGAQRSAPAIVINLTLNAFFTRAIKRAIDGPDAITAAIRLKRGLFMRILIAAMAMACGLFTAARSAEAAVDIQVDLSTQRMTVHAGGQNYVWPVSTARPGYVTPRGTFHPQSLQLMHYSSKYENSPMPHSIFFHGGYAIHGTYEAAHLGRPASHGCVRLSTGNAATLYALVKAEGATITISGSSPSGGHVAARTSPRRHPETAAPASDSQDDPFRF